MKSKSGCVMLAIGESNKTIGGSLAAVRKRSKMFKALGAFLMYQQGSGVAWSCAGSIVALAQHCDCESQGVDLFDCDLRRRRSP